MMSDAVDLSHHRWHVQVRYLQGEAERLREKVKQLERDLQASHQVQVSMHLPYTVSKQSSRQVSMHLPYTVNK